MTNFEKHIDLARSLRDAADWIEENAFEGMEQRLCCVTFYCKSKDDFRTAARSLGTFDKVKDSALSDFYYIVRRKFGGLELDVQIDRNKVCKKVKVMREVDEYECADSILDPTPEAAEIEAQREERIA